MIWDDIGPLIGISQRNIPSNLFATHADMDVIIQTHWLCILSESLNFNGQEDVHRIYVMRKYAGASSRFTVNTGHAVEMVICNLYPVLIFQFALRRKR